MAYCRDCGALLQEGTKYCSACGAPAENRPVRAIAPPVEYPVQRPMKRRKPLLARWWFWALVLIAAAAFTLKNGGLPDALKVLQRESAPVTATAKPAQHSAETPVPSAEAAQNTPAPAQSEIRPEVKEFLDAYEACMDEYVAFMQKYASADPADTLSMLGDYYSILARYNDFAEKIDAVDEDELTSAELAYYIEVTSRVSMKLLSAAG